MFCLKTAHYFKACAFRLRRQRELYPAVTPLVRKYAVTCHSVCLKLLNELPVTPYLNLLINGQNIRYL